MPPLLQQFSCKYNYSPNKQTNLINTEIRFALLSKQIHRGHRAPIDGIGHAYCFGSTVSCLYFYIRASVS